MKPFSSLASVIALWLAVSFTLWLCYVAVRRRDGNRQRKLIDNALALIGESRSLFEDWRNRSTANASPRAASGKPAFRQEDDIREDVRTLLNRIEASSAFFDQVNAAKKKIQKTFNLPDFLPLSEILQIRRDFWAASEIFLMDDIRSLGPELADDAPTKPSGGKLMPFSSATPSFQAMAAFIWNIKIRWISGLQSPASRQTPFLTRWIAASLRNARKTDCHGPQRSLPCHAV